MIVSQLYAAVAQLGFEDSLEYESGFVYAANRALLQISVLRPEKRYYTVNHSPLDNLITGLGFAPVMKIGDLTYEASGAVSYYFEVCGYGVAYIEKYNSGNSAWEHIGSSITFDTSVFLPHRGFILDGGERVDGRVRLRFSGEYSYSVRCVAMYGSLLRPEAEFIPAYSEFVPYDISDCVDDFLSLCSPPIRVDAGHSRTLVGYRVENDSVILLPRSAAGVYKIVYNHKPESIRDDALAATDGTKIDLDEELCALLPLLVASYVWMDDEPEKAQYYLALYQGRAAEIAGRYRNTSPAQIKDSYGWV